MLCCSAQETVVVAAPAYEGRGIILATVSRRPAARPSVVADDVAAAAADADADAVAAPTSMLVRMQRSLSGAFHIRRNRTSSAASGAGVSVASTHATHAYRQLGGDEQGNEMVERGDTYTSPSVREQPEEKQGVV